MILQVMNCDGTNHNINYLSSAKQKKVQVFLFFIMYKPTFNACFFYNSFLSLFKRDSCK